MQTLGLSESTPRSESRSRALLWPTIRNSGDLDYVTQQGFWICFIVAVFSFVYSVMAGALIGSVLGGFETLFFFLAGVGVRERNRAAGMAAFAAYFLSALVLQRYKGNGFGSIRIIFLALLFANIRGNWLASRWTAVENDLLPIRLNETLTDKLVDWMPPLLWPKAKIVFYVLAVLEIAILLIALFAPAPTAESSGRPTLAHAPITSASAPFHPHSL